MKKTLFLVLACFFGNFVGFAQTTRYKGTLVTESYTQKDVIVQVVENNNKANGTIYKAKVSRAIPMKFDLDIKGLSRLVQDDKVYISGNNLTPYLENKAMDKYKLMHFNAVKSGDTFQFKTFLGKKKISYEGKKI